MDSKSNVFECDEKVVTKLQVPERVLRTVRVTISTKEEFEQRVRIGVLLVGDQDQVGVKI